MLTIDIAIEAEDWGSEKALAELSSQALNAAEQHLTSALLPDSEVSLLFTSDDHVQVLNAQYRQQDKPTNVLSFAANEGSGPVTPLLGDIVLAFETVKKEAENQEKPFESHLSHLIIHGFLHLLGHDHIIQADAERMEALETRILASLNISDPYTAPPA